MVVDYRAFVALAALLAVAPSIVEAQVVASGPASARTDPPPVSDAARLSLVVADTVSETDPQPLCARPDCGSLFLGSYTNAVVLAGPAVPRAFSARVEMGSPWNMRYRLALIVEHRDGGEPLVRAVAGFNLRTGEACFDTRETEPLEWQVSGAGIVVRGDVLCVIE